MRRETCTWIDVPGFFGGNVATTGKNHIVSSGFLSSKAQIESLQLFATHIQHDIAELCRMAIRRFQCLGYTPKQPRFQASQPSQPTQPPQAERQRFEELLAEERREKEAPGRTWWCSAIFIQKRLRAFTLFEFVWKWGAPPHLWQCSWWTWGF